MPLLPNSNDAPIAGATAGSAPAVGATPTERVNNWLARFSATTTSRDAAGTAALFQADGIWRDLVALTWNLKTAEGRDSIADMLRTTLPQAEPRGWTVDGEVTTGSNPELGEWDEAWLNFETNDFRAKAVLRLRGGLAWTLLTSARELTKFPEPRGKLRPLGAQHGAFRDRVTWKDRQDEERRTLGYETQPYVVIVGGGQGGMGVAARLRLAGVPTVVIEKNERPGDSWRNRYRSLCLHDPVWYDNMPYLPFPDNWPIFTPKDKMGDFLESYVKIMEINYWASSTVKKCSWDEANQEWVVDLHRKIGRNGTPEDVTLRPKQLVLATGMSGRPNMPKLKGADKFKGHVHHSSQHPGGEPYRGKRCVVLGANNSAHDIAADLWESGASEVTIVQRSSTHIIRSDTFTDVITKPFYSEEALAKGITTDKADMMFASFPYKILAAIQRPGVVETKRRDAEFYKQLEARGFMLDFGDDDSGLFLKYLRRGSGYYIDVGASGLVISGDIKLKSRVTIDHLTEDKVVLTDGSSIDADLVVCATGYGSMNGWAEVLVDKETADRVGKCWGLGSETTKDPGPWEGELRNMWKPTQVRNLWFHGGNLHQSRHYSRYLSLQLKARYENIPTPVYGIGKAYHTS